MLGNVSTMGKLLSFLVIRENISLLRYYEENGSKTQSLMCRLINHSIKLCVQSERQLSFPSGVQKCLDKKSKSFVIKNMICGGMRAHAFERGKELGTF